MKKLFLGLIILFATAVSAQDLTQKTSVNGDKLPVDTSLVGKKYKVTFVELGSVRCIPCQKMQVVIKSIEANYGNQVKTIFYDVWTKEGKPYAELYKINLIPVQVFLDENGVEFFRHEGYFPEEELVKVLESKGVEKN